MTTKLAGLEPQKHNAILNAALKEFALKGFDNASTNIIAKDAGISKALMFHYVSSKQELFLFVYEYFSTLLDSEYYSLMDYSVKDIFDRLRQSYLLQLELLKKHPWIFEFNKLSVQTNSDRINKAVNARTKKVQASCDAPIFDNIDVSRFKVGLDIEKCKQQILWSNMGFASQILDDIRHSPSETIDYAQIIIAINEYFDDLQKLFYIADRGQST